MVKMNIKEKIAFYGVLGEQINSIESSMNWLKETNSETGEEYVPDYNRERYHGYELLLGVLNEF